MKRRKSLDVVAAVGMLLIITELIRPGNGTEPFIREVVREQNRINKENQEVMRIFCGSNPDEGLEFDCS